jgi:hypothetical protein
MIAMLTSNLIANAKGALEGLTKGNITFERTVKHGKNLSTKKYEVRTGCGFVGLMRKNRAELCAAALGLAATCIVLLQGQATSAIPLFYLAAVWLITSVKDYAESKYIESLVDSSTYHHYVLSIHKLLLYNKTRINEG